ncbi:MAG: OmpA family protein [Gammaproteobacteria bacterium]|nr:OmpA family protein [Gammaproteobacteria bacterium]
MNQASVDYLNTSGQPSTTSSNVSQIVTAVVRSPATVEFTRVVGPGAGDFVEPIGPAWCFAGGAFASLADPVLSGGTTINPLLLHEVSGTAFYNLSEPLFLRLLDTDQNVDASVIDFADVTVVHDASNDTETIRLSETGISTGVFVGYLPTARAAPVPGDCVLQGSMNTTVTAGYTDPADVTDSAQASASLDPVNLVFDSRTGSFVDGTTVEIVDASTGLPAPVFGNDGVSTFPSRVTAGVVATDSSGASYPFGPGEFRFPVVPPGDYRLVVTPPPEYAAPSAETMATLQLLPGAPYALGAASFGTSFTHGGVSVDFDIPVDPRSSSLFLTMNVSTATAAPGDFIRYELTVENSSTAGTATNVSIINQLPPGVRLVPGSVTLNGSGVVDPIISPDSMSLEFDIGTLPANGQATITFVVQIVAGKSLNKLVNQATAYADGGLTSNAAVARIQLKEDLFRSTATIIGRVLNAPCTEKTFTEDQGVANVRIYLEDGRYAVSDQGGRFHFEDIRPGRHIAQLDWVTVPEYLEVARCDIAPAHAGRGDAQLVDVSRGSVKRADFYLRNKPAAEGLIDIELQNHGTQSAEEIAYVLKLHGSGDVHVNNIDLMVMLPDGVSYLPGTMQVDGGRVIDPRITGQALNFAIVDHGNNWLREISFTGNIAIDVHGELVTRARARFDSPTESGQMTPVADAKVKRAPSVAENDAYEFNFKFDPLSAALSSEDLDHLDRLIDRWRGVRDIQIASIGHTDSYPIALRSRDRFADNYVLSQARASSAALYIAENLKVPNENVQLQGRGPDHPVADNTTEAGRKQNRHVELILSGIRPTRPSFLEVTKVSSGVQTAETRGEAPGVNVKIEDPVDLTSPFDLGAMSVSEIEPDIGTLSPGVDMLLPTENFQAAAPVTRISIKHEPRQTVVAYLNNELVNPLNFAGTETDPVSGIAISRWAGVDLREGANNILIEVNTPEGDTAFRLERSIHFASAAVRGEFVEELSILVADGKTRPVIAVRLFDKYSKPSRPGSVGMFRVNSPYRSWWDVINDRKNELISVGHREPIYRIGKDGIALIELEPTTQAGGVTVQLRFEQQHSQEIRTWISAAPRDWILVGFAEGTVGYNTLADNKVVATAAGHEAGYYSDGRIAFFAKGKIKGEYLLTLTYDSDGNKPENGDRFLTQVDPTAFYSLYADESEQRFEASSQRKLYVKLERDQFLALFGDFNTGLSVTELARYQRSFNGFKAEYHGDNVGYSVFATETDQSFVRDEIRGDGTSGLYRLGSAPIITNSESVRIEVRDRFDTARVLSSISMSRFLDYNLDALDGTMFFKKPVQSRDASFNPIFIVVEYESNAAANKDVIAGGRASLRNDRDTLEVGISHIDEGQQGVEADLSGIDFRWRATDTTLVKAEFARTNRTVAGVEQQADAYLVSVEHRGERSDVRAYVKKVEQNFGLGHQSAAESGVKDAGVDGRLRITEQITLEGEAAKQHNLQTGTDRTVARALVRFENGRFTASTGIAYAEDEFSDGETRTSEFVEYAVGQRMLDGKITLRANGSTSVGKETENSDYPTRLVLGADYHLMEGVDLFAEWEDSSSQDIDATMTRAGVRASPWSRAQINTSVTNQSTEFGPRVFANVGLVQGFQLNEKWLLDAGIDQTRTLVQPDARVFDTDRELVSGSLDNDFLTGYVGALYNADSWSANTRLEYRKSDVDKRSTIISGWYREPRIGHSLSAGLTVFASENISGARTTAADFKFAWAYRMAGGTWSFLDRTDLVFEESASTSVELESWRFINNFNANRRISASSQISLQYAFKYVKTNFDATEFSGYTDLLGFDFRRGFNAKWDGGLHASIYHSYATDTFDYGFGVDVGYNLRDNIWLNLGYNLFGFHDRDFAAARYTAQGPFITIGIRADQTSLKGMVNRRRHRESDPVVDGRATR